MSDPVSASLREHPAGCTYGGFSCGYWMVAEGCELYHPERHVVTDDRCPCGNEFPGFGSGIAISDAEMSTGRGPVR